MPPNVTTLYSDRHTIVESIERADLVIGAGYDPNDPKFQGADQLAVEWAKAHGVPGFCYPAFWKQDGRSAGPRRNQRQLEKFKPDIVVALPGGDGTADMVERATRAGVSLRPSRSGSSPIAARISRTAAAIRSTSRMRPSHNRRLASRYGWAIDASLLSGRC